MIRKIFVCLTLLAIATGLQACAAKPSPEEACNFVQNSEKQRVSWGSQVPVLIYIDRSVPSIYYDSIRSAVDEWNARVGREVLKVGGWGIQGGQPGQDSANVIYFLQSWESDRSNEQARTTVYWAGDRIYEADIRINDRDFDFFEGGRPVPGQVDMQSLMLHELGHVLGLAHAPTPQSVMARSLPSATFRRQLSEADQDSIRCEY